MLVAFSLQLVHNMACLFYIQERILPPPNMIKKTSICIFIMATVFLSGCAHYRFRIIVQDQYDNPVPDAIIYAESYDYKGAVDFTWVRAGTAIEVPPPGQPPITLQGSNSTHIAIAVFAKGKKPLIIYDAQGELNPELWEYILEAGSATGAIWNPHLAKLQFPFVHQPDLYNRLKAEDQEQLVCAFLEAYAPLRESIENKQALRSEVEKYDFLLNKIRPFFTNTQSPKK
ncbi:hypothetical protein JW933_03175 [candidate division FCPU426 bacterium]|nr:hypothetical protein [candidate division FCPU426 bacterium]